MATKLKWTKNNFNYEQHFRMDALVDRLWELANEDDDLHTARRVERITEARALWRALEVLLTSLKLQEFVVGDGAFPKLLASIRSVLSDPSYWVDKPSKEDSNSVFICVNRVLLNVGRRGAHEREALVRDGVADLVVQCGEAAQNYPLTALEAIAALQTLQLLVADSLQVSHTIRMCISLMHKHETVYALQLRACQFLRQMALEEECKERVGRRGGLQALTKALTRFPEETELVVTALDVLGFLCAELEYRDDSVQTDPFRSANSNDLYRVVRAVVDTMRVLQSVERVQSKGVAVLNSIVIHPPVKKALCLLNIWNIAENRLSTTATDAVACDIMQLLDALLRDPVTCETLRQMPDRSSLSSQCQNITKPRLKDLKNRVEALRHSRVANRETSARMAFVSTQLQSLLNGMGCNIPGERFNHQNDQLVRTCANSNGYGQFTNIHNAISYNFAHSDNRGDEISMEAVRNLRNGNGTRGEDTSGLLLEGGTGYFEKFIQQTKDSCSTTISSPCSSLVSTVAELDGLDQFQPLSKAHPDAKVYTKVQSTTSVLQPSSREQVLNSTLINSCPSTVNGELGMKHAKNEIYINKREAERSNSERHHSSTDEEAAKWQALYEASTREVQRLQNSVSELNERYQIVLRRSKEQTKLLALQNARIKNHGNEHQQILRRLRTLESSLDEAERRCQTERTLRSAETLQCEQLSLALHESVRESKSLAAQQSSAVRELQQTQSMRTEYMSRTRENNEKIQRVELERNNALIQIENMKQEKIKILHQLADCRREGHESLLMREEDVNARRPGVFSELAQATTARKAVQKTVGVLQMGIAIVRRNSLPSESLADKLPESMDSSPLASSSYRSVSIYPIQPRSRSVDEDFNDDPDSIDTSEIQRSLVAVFESLDKSNEGSNEEIVHVSTVRRFFMESGLVQAPNVLPADVDVVLTGVLAQALTHRKNSIVRKDFSGAPQTTWAPPTGWAKSKKRMSPTKSASFTGDVQRFRFFNQDAFNEAVTLVGMRRFPRSDLLRVLQTVVALYLRPYLRQREALHVPKAIKRSRSSSTFSISRRPSSAGSPSYVCTRAMKTILNGLALHLGHGNADEHLRTFQNTNINMGEVRCHLNPPSSMNRSHKREDVVYSMLEMNGILNREQRALGTICEYYSAQHLPNAAAAAAIAITKTELFGLSFELLLNFAIDFDLVPSFMDRVSLKHLHTEVAGLLKSYFSLHDKDMPTGADAETLKKVAFGMLLARLALELFSTKPGYETPEQQITGLLQWLDNSPGREKIMKKTGIPLVIRFSRQLYAVKAQQNR